MKRQKASTTAAPSYPSRSRYQPRRKALLCAGLLLVSIGGQSIFDRPEPRRVAEIVQRDGGNHGFLSPGQAGSKNQQQGREEERLAHTPHGTRPGAPVTTLLLVESQLASQGDFSA